MDRPSAHRLALSFGLAALLAAPGPALAQAMDPVPVETHGADEVATGEAGEAVMAAIRATREAFLRGDADTLDRILAPGWECFIAMPSTQSHSRREEWLANARKRFAAGVHIKVEPKEEFVSVSPEMAWYRGTESWTWLDGENKPTYEVTWLSTLVWQKTGGQWQLAHSHHSYVQKAGKGLEP